jgi:hypothetical protein
LEKAQATGVVDEGIPMNRNLQSEIAQRAYFIWEEEGRPNGRALEHWIKAEEEVAKGARGKPGRQTRPRTTTRRRSTKTSGSVQ